MGLGLGGAARGPSRALPSHKTHPSASSSKMLLPQFGTLIILISASAVNLFIAL